jgi:hypothetical protein
MAIYHAHYNVLRHLHEAGELRSGALLEIGEANWYGDIPPPCDAPDWFEVVKRLYRDWFGATKVASIDLNGPTAMKLDLNKPIALAGDTRLARVQFSTVINHGTAEHVFNIANVFKVMHDHCAAGGLMIHDAPCYGWLDHGFYTLQPTLFYDLAAANQYDLRYMAVTSLHDPMPIRIANRDGVSELLRGGKLPQNAMLMVAMRKVKDEPFRIPMQGYYADTLSQEGKRAWHTNR